MSAQKQRPASVSKTKKRGLLSKMSTVKDHLEYMEETEERKSTKAPKKSIKLGICAMKKKVQGKPMREVLARLKCDWIEFVYMWECLDSPYWVWPIVDALICFYSDGFPYLKAWKYVQKYKPYLINDLHSQQLLWDRTVVYGMLKKIHVPVAKHYMVFRDKNYIYEMQKLHFGVCEDFPQYEISNQQSSRNSRVNDEEQEGKLNNLRAVLSDVSPPKDFEKQLKKTSSKAQIRKQFLNNTMSDIYRERQSGRSFLGSKNSQILNNRLPTKLKAYHENRMSKIQDYEVEEVDDCLIIKSKDNTFKLNKPFVEKPFDAENHEIAIYYPQSMGGGRKMLFRKVKNSSSANQQQSEIRRDGNYIYEEFLPNNAFDIKVYAIGQYYMYAEARKSPTLDGVVDRNLDGKEKRYPIILTPQEKFIGQKIVQAFGQDVCGFDLLRANGKSYVCDVNGWSFVKSNNKYWDDCAKILKRKINMEFFPEKIQQENKQFQRFISLIENKYKPQIRHISFKQELRSIVSIFRHGDRSPKQKLKIVSKDQRFLDFFNDTQKKQLKLKDPKNLIKVLNITNGIIAQMNDLSDPNFNKMVSLKTALQSGGGHFQGLNRKLQLKVLQAEDDPDRPGKTKVKQVLLVMKWGGQLSRIGCMNAIQFGQRLRMERYKEDHDFLSLHASYRHDLKTYSSDEGRCIQTAAAFLKGFLNIQGGSLAPIITSMVNSHSKAAVLLDCTSQQNHSSLFDAVKKQLSEMLNSEQLLMTNFSKKVKFQEMSEEMKRIINEIGYPRQKLAQMHKLIVQLTRVIQNQQMVKWQKLNKEELIQKQQTGKEQEKQIVSSPQDIMMIYKRWSKLQKDFYSQKDKIFNISKIPQIYDTIRYDRKKNNQIFSSLQKNVQEIRQLARLLAYFVVPNQYGFTDEQKLSSARLIVSPLMQKVYGDLMFWKEKKYQDEYWKYKNEDTSENWRHVRTRLYFTSASHLYSILNFVTLGNNRELLKLTTPKLAETVKNIVYMSYLSHFQFRLYEDLACENDDPNRFRVELTIHPDYNKDEDSAEVSLGNPGFKIDQISNFFNTMLPKIISN